MLPYSMIKRKHQGAHGELIACAWLLRQGYEVFRNISAHGIVDIIGMKDGIVELYDVKSGTNSLQVSQVNAGVKLLRVSGQDCFIELGKKLS